MKAIIKIFYILTILFIVSCEWLAMDKGRCFHIKNDSNLDIYTYAAYIAPDTLLPIKKPNLKLIPSKTTCTCVYLDREFGDYNFKRLQKGEYITIFFFSKDPIDSHNWDYIQEKNIYLKKCKYTKDSGSQIYFSDER